VPSLYLFAFFGYFAVRPWLYPRGTLPRGGVQRLIAPELPARVAKGDKPGQPKFLRSDTG